MMFLVIAIALLVLGHYIKAYRLKQFIDLYEKPNESVILKSLSLGYLINFVVPYKIGDIFRAWFMGRKMKNGTSFSLALIIIDRILDIIMVGLIFIVIFIVGIRTETVLSSILFYIVLAISVLVIIVLAYKFKYIVKKCVHNFSMIFNENIELKILKFFWYLITSFKDMLLKIKKSKLIFSTLAMWTTYLLSYYLFALASKNLNYDTNFIDIFLSLFSNNSLDLSTGNLALNNYLMLIYLIVPLFILIIISKIKKVSKNNCNDSEKKYLEILPQANIKDKLTFLNGYFSSKSSEYYNNYIMLNQDISIIQDYSAGSNATTMLCTDGNKMFFRKYAFGNDSLKLYEQLCWLKKYKKYLPLTSVTNIKKNETDEYCSYDMPYNKNSMGCFNYVHSVSIDNAWEMLFKVLNSLKKLYNSEKREATKKDIEKYIEQKVEKNITKIESGKYIKPLLKYDTLIINGKEYKNFKYFKKYLSKSYLFDLFKDDEYSEIHGDLTIENIICCDLFKEGFYIIDPNTGNIHNSPYLDYSKLLQSLHGGYEFLMNTKNIEISENNIKFLSTKSLVYDELFKRYNNYLLSEFDIKQVKNIYFHEIIHWLRLLPYKIEKNEERSVLFYSELIIILNYVIERFCENE